MWFALILFTFLFQYSAPNKISSAVYELNDKFLNVMDQGLWFVKFYAPWCAHCKRLAPKWEHLGHAIADRNSKIRVGKVDCTRYPSVASALSITGYPTLIFFREGFRILYKGEKEKEKMLEFAEKSAGLVIEELVNLNKIYDLKKQSEKNSFFVYIKQNENVTIKNSELLKIYQEAAQELFTEIHFFVASASLFSKVKNFRSELLTKNYDFVIVVKDHRYVYFDLQIKKPNELRKWINQERWPLLPQIFSTNIHNIANSTQKMLVLMVGDVTEMIGRANINTQTGKFFAMFKKAAFLTYDNAELHKKYQYGWIDDILLIKNVLMGEISLPNMLVFNLTSYEFYLNEDASSIITEQSIQTFLTSISNNYIKPRGGRSWPTRIRRMIYEITSNLQNMFYHQPILTICLFGVPLAFFSIIFYSVCSADFTVDRSEIYPDDIIDDDDEFADYKDFKRKNKIVNDEENLSSSDSLQSFDQNEEVDTEESELDFVDNKVLDFQHKKAD